MVTSESFYYLSNNLMMVFNQEISPVVPFFSKFVLRLCP